MYDEYARQLIDSIPELADLDRANCRRALSKAYLYIVRSRIGVSNNDNEIGDFLNVRDTLRGMADSLESIAVFDHINGLVSSDQVESACAFVAAESLALLGDMTQEQNPMIFDPIQNENFYIKIEAALLYMIGGYDINAFSIINNISIPALLV